MNRKQKYEAKARAYEIVVQHIMRLHENGAYEDENVVTVDELNKIVELLEKKRNRKIEIGNTPPKKRVPKSTIKPARQQVMVIDANSVFGGLGGNNRKRGGK